MSLEFWTVASIAMGLGAFYIFLPWLESEGAKFSSETEEFLNLYQTAYQDREISLESLKDLELDFRTGKIQSSDYEELRQRLLERAVAKSQELEVFEKEHPIFNWIEEASQKLAKRKESDASSS